MEHACVACGACMSSRPWGWAGVDACAEASWFRTGCSSLVAPGSTLRGAVLHAGMQRQPVLTHLRPHTAMHPTPPPKGLYRSLLQSGHMHGCMYIAWQQAPEPQPARPSMHEIIDTACNRFRFRLAHTPPWSHSRVHCSRDRQWPAQALTCGSRVAASGRLRR